MLSTYMASKATSALLAAHCFLRWKGFGHGHHVLIWGCSVCEAGQDKEEGMGWNDSHCPCCPESHRVTSQFDYFNAPYVRLPSKTLQKLQLVQNAAACAAAGAQQLGSVGSLICWLHWLPVHFWASFKVVVLTYKALNDLGTIFEGPPFPNTDQLIPRDLQRGTFFEGPPFTEARGSRERNDLLCGGSLNVEYPTRWITISPLPGPFLTGTQNFFEKIQTAFISGKDGGKVSEDIGRRVDFMTSYWLFLIGLFSSAVLGHCDFKCLFF